MNRCAVRVRGAAPLKGNMKLFDIHNIQHNINMDQVMYTKVVDKIYTLYAFVDGSVLELKHNQDEWSKKEIKPIKMEDIKYK